MSFEKRFINVLGKKLAYVEKGHGDPIIFLHGNPTSSYLWRNIIPYLEDHGRCIAVDLIGMGDSEKLEDNGNMTYSYQVHQEYLSEFLEIMSINENVILILHDWGSALGFNWAYDNAEKVKGICYMEAIVKSMQWVDWNEDARGIFQGFRSAAGEEMIFKKNLFIEAVLPGSILRKLSDEEMNEYRRPFNDETSRRPMLDWPRQIPLENEPPEICKIVESYSQWMVKNELPKLFINAEPGAILIGKQREFCRTWKNQKEVTVKGSHFIQEDSPNEIGSAIFDWLSGLN